MNEARGTRVRNLERVTPSRFFPLLLLALSACTSPAPRLHLPIRTEANCESKSVKQTAIDSIIASVDDTVREGKYPGDGVLRKSIENGGGVFAYWKDQPFRAPDTAKGLGVPGDLELKRAVITNEVQGSDNDRVGRYRPVWLTFATPHGDVTVLERAYDIQNVCIEGRRQV
ncbi:MAG: hypothetical protein QOD51_76 [Candidatus Eremiobacteraeota bacterium]|nr:hypothetical protein [Candidatus Eremiobacteraeota bacterium]